MAQIVTITNPLTGQPAQVDQLEHTAQEIDDATARALPGGAIDIALQNKADLGEDGKVPSAQLPAMNYAPSTHASQHASSGSDPITPKSINAVPVGAPVIYNLPLSDGHTAYRPSFYTKNALNEVWVHAEVSFGASEDGTVSKIITTMPAGYKRGAYFFVPGMLYHDGAWLAELILFDSNGNVLPYNTTPNSGDIAICNAIYYAN